MGEAKRRKKLDPNYGKSKVKRIVFDKTKLEVDNENEITMEDVLSLLKEKSKKTDSKLKSVDNFDDVNELVDGIWEYEDENGESKMSFTGDYAQKALNLFLKY